MKDFQFNFPTNIIFGHKAENEIGRQAACHGRHALILYGSDRIKKNGLLDQIQSRLEAEGVASLTFGGIQENPLLSTAENACRMVREKNIDLLIAVGGGSIIDTAKAVSIGTVNDIPIWDMYEEKEAPTQALPIGVVLTMAATASEANCVSVIVNDHLNQKKAYRCPYFYPKFALLDPELTYTIPAKQTAIGALDIFSHSFERYFHLEQRGTLRLNLCAAVMKTVITELPKAIAKPDDYDSRSQLMWAATVSHSDMVGFDGVFACHAMSHILTGEFGLAHGAALAILMPAWCKYMLCECAEKMAEFAQRVWDVNGEFGTDQLAIAQEGIYRFQRFIGQNGLPVTLREAGILHADSQKLAEKTIDKDGCLGEAFRALNQKDVQAIYELARG